MIDVSIFALITALVSLGWHIFTYFRSRVRLRIDLSPNMQLFIGDQLGEEKFINMNISNVGGQPTTLQKVVIFGYKNKLSYIQNKPSIKHELQPTKWQPKFYYDDDFGNTPELPHFLGLGSIWQTQLIQTKVEETIEKHALKYVYIGVYDSSRKKIRLKMLSSLKAP